MTDTQPNASRWERKPFIRERKTVAELEVEARERAQAQRKESAPVEDVKPDQPEVNSLKSAVKSSYDAGNTASGGAYRISTDG